MNILLLEDSFSEYLQYRDLLRALPAWQGRLLWCSQFEHLETAVYSGVYDLVLLNPDVGFEENLLETITAGFRTPAVLLVEGHPVSRYKQCLSDFVGLFDRVEKDSALLGHYLLCADLNRIGQLDKKNLYPCSLDKNKIEYSTDQQL